MSIYSSFVRMITSSGILQNEESLIILMLSIMAAGSAAQDLRDREKPPEAKHFIRGDYSQRLRSRER